MEVSVSKKKLNITIPTLIYITIINVNNSILENNVLMIRKNYWSKQNPAGGPYPL